MRGLRHDVRGHPHPARCAATMASTLLLASTSALGVAVPARATGAPTMPLADVHAGARCVVRSVLHGTTPESFDADVVDVVTGDVTGEGPRILVRVSGRAIATTGIGPGFSGSPVLCPDGLGVLRIAGAISEGVGDRTNRLALATPIEAVLATPPRGSGTPLRSARAAFGGPSTRSP